MQPRQLEPKRPDDDDDVDESPPSTQRSPTYPEPELFWRHAKRVAARSRNDRFWDAWLVDAFSGI
jgi:hypothetical protein